MSTQIFQQYISPPRPNRTQAIHSRTKRMMKSHITVQAHTSSAAAYSRVKSYIKRQHCIHLSSGGLLLLIAKQKSSFWWRIRLSNTSKYAFAPFPPYRVCVIIICDIHAFNTTVQAFYTMSQLAVLINLRIIFKRSFHNTFLYSPILRQRYFCLKSAGGFEKSSYWRFLSNTFPCDAPCTRAKNLPDGDMKLIGMP